MPGAKFCSMPAPRSKPASTFPTKAMSRGDPARLLATRLSLRAELAQRAGPYRTWAHPSRRLSRCLGRRAQCGKIQPVESAGTIRHCHCHRRARARRGMFAKSRSIWAVNWSSCSTWRACGKPTARPKPRAFAARRRKWARPIWFCGYQPLDQPRSRRRCDGYRVWHGCDQDRHGRAFMAHHHAISSTDRRGPRHSRCSLRTLASEARRHGEPPLLSRERDRASLEAAIRASMMRPFDRSARTRRRSAARRLGSLERLLGRIDTEMVLDRLFSAFCIGK